MVEDSYDVLSSRYRSRFTIMLDGQRAAENYQCLILLLLWVV